TDFWFNPGYEHDQDFYLDVVSIDRSALTWRTVDLYVDIVIRTGRGLEVIDTEELLEATSTDLLTRQQAAEALRTTYNTINGLARHNYDLVSWLATRDIHLTWQRRS